MSKNFVNFHVLISHSPSCLNRDDMNMQKTATFGGVRRIRISSQSLKRAMRKSDYYVSNLGAASIRTRDLESLIPVFTETLREEFEPALITKTMELFVKTNSTDEDEAEEQEDGGNSDSGKGKKLAVAPWSIEEIRLLCGVIKEVALSDEEVKAAKEKAAKQKGKKKKTEQEFVEATLSAKRAKAVKEQIENLRKAIGSTVDIALSGRMATSGLMTSVDGAMAVAHAITTHMAEADIDWFTAVDDLVPLGSGHLDTQEFSSGVFYRYASLNINQLQKNLGDVSRERALEVAAHVLHLFATVVPSAKQQSFAAHNPADFALVSLADQPISLANAFERPVKNKDGFLAPSIATALEYWDKIHRGFGLDERTAAFSLASPQWPSGIQNNSSLPELENWLRADGNA